jgi:hypothetical protein
VSQPKINAAFLELISAGGDLLQELGKGGTDLSPDLRMRVNVYKGAHQRALSLAKTVPNPTNLPPSNVFGGGPESNPPSRPPPEGGDHPHSHITG